MALEKELPEEISYPDTARAHPKTNIPIQKVPSAGLVSPVETAEEVADCISWEEYAGRDRGEAEEYQDFDLPPQTDLPYDEYFKLQRAGALASGKRRSSVQPAVGGRSYGRTSY